MNTDRATPDRDLLAELCEKHGMKAELIEELLKIEKEHQLRDRRHGIYDRLREAIQESLAPQPRMD